MTVRYEHEFETTLGDELSESDLQNATYKIVETFVDVEVWRGGGVTEILVVFTHRVELHQTDDQILEGLED